VPMASTVPSSPKPIQVKDNLSLKVVRLSKPAFNVKSPILCESTDAVAYGLTPEEPFGMSPFLTLPSSFGKLFVGEVFTSYITINNTSTTNVSSVAIKVSLQTPTNERITLLEVPGSAIPVFSPGDSQDFVISQDIVDEGTYILVCSAGYIRTDGEKKHLRKFFQFEVEQPFTITPKTQTINSDVFAEIQVKNASSVIPLFLDNLEFVPSKGFTVESLNQAAPSGLSNFLKPSQIQQYLYKLQPSKDERPGHSLGHLLIDWKSTTSSYGRLETQTFKRAMPPPQEFQVEISELPQEIKLEVPFNAKCTVTNNSVQKLAPKLCSVPEKQVGIAVNGVSGCCLPVLAPGESCSVKLSFFPLLPGIQSINGLRIVEQQFDKKYDFDKLVDVFVQFPPRDE